MRQGKGVSSVFPLKRLWETDKQNSKGIQVGTKNITYLPYDDDSVLISYTRDDLTQIVISLKAVLSKIEPIVNAEERHTH